MKPLRVPSLFLLVLLLALGLAACAPTAAQQGTPYPLPGEPTLPADYPAPALSPTFGPLTTPQDTPLPGRETPTETAAAIPLMPTGTRVVLPTLIPTQTPTPSPAPSETPSSPFLVQDGTPIPVPLTPISVDNAAQLKALAMWREENVSDMAWTPDGGSLAVATFNSIGLYDVPTRTRWRSLYPKTEGITDIEFSPSGDWLVVGSRTGSDTEGFFSSMELWRGPDLQPYGVLFSSMRGLNAFAFSNTHSLFAVAYTSPVISDNSVDLWNWVTWNISYTIETGPALNIAFTPDGKYLATSPDHYSIRVFTVKTGSPYTSFPTSFTGAVSSMAFAPSGSLLATGHHDGTIRLWDLQSSSLVYTTGLEGLGSVEGLAFSPDGTLLATGHAYGDQNVRLWEVSTGALLSELPGHLNGVTRLAFSPDMQMLVTASYDGQLFAWGLRP